MAGTGRTAPLGGPGWRRADAAAALLCAAYGLLLYALLSSLPLFGDAVGYAYRTADWIARSGMSLVPSGTGRGAQAMGHPAAYFWIWALLMRVFGDTVRVAHLLPALFAALAVFSTWLLASRMAGRAAGAWAALSLGVSPLFLAQAMQPLQDVPFAAFAALSMWSFHRRRPLAAAAWCAAATACREQAMLLAGCFVIVEVMHSGFRRVPRLLLYCSPVLVIVATGLVNLLANGYFFRPEYLGATPGPADGWLADRTRHFFGHLYAGDGRWILVSTALAAGLTRVSRSRLPVASALMLLSPAVLYPPGRLLWLAAAGLAALVLLVRRGELPEPAGMVLVAFPAAMAAFHVLIVLVSPDKDLNLFRYLLGAYPPFLVSCFALLRREGGVRAVHLVGLLFVVFTVLAGTRAVDRVQPDITPAYLRLPFAERRMVELGASSADSLVIPLSDMDIAISPGLGYVDRALPAVPLGEGTRLRGCGTVYALLVPYAESRMQSFSELVMKALPEGYGLDTISVWRSGILELALLRAEPAS